jgi:Flp pilus assembly protein TadG
VYRPIHPYVRRASRLGAGSERGATVLVFTLFTLLLVVPMVGLAIDGSIALWTKAKLSAAVDAAALAAARSLSTGGTIQQEQAVGQQVAQEWFAANFPSGWLGTTIVSGSPSVTVAQSSLATRTVSVSASVVAPLYFLRLFGGNYQNVTISEYAQSSRRNVVLLLVLDRSGSMGAPPIGSGSCATMIADAQSFVSNFSDGFDTLGLITYSSAANLDYSPTLYFKSSTPSLSATIGQIGCTGATSMTQALNLAWQTIQTVNQPGSLNVIVLFTDGQPNVINASWPVRLSSDTNYYRYDAVNTSTYDTSMPVYCSSSANISGSMTILIKTSPYTPPGTTGYTGGIYNPAPQRINQGSVSPVSAPGCAFYNNGITYVREDVAYIPGTDAYGNATSGYLPVDTFPSGDSYAGKPRVDEQIPALIAAAKNTADNQAHTIRYNSAYPVIIYTIGLDGAPDMSVDQQFLERVANDPHASNYDPTVPTGQFAYAPNASQLQMAFYEIASEIMRLSQ